MEVAGLIANIVTIATGVCLAYAHRQAISDAFKRHRKRKDDDENKTDREEPEE